MQARTVMTIAKNTWAVIELVVAARSPMPTTGTELPP